MTALFPSILKILALLGALISISEDAFGPGTGDQKKAKVIADVQERLPGLAAELAIPEWAIVIFTNASVLGMLIDSFVAIANTSGHFSGPKLARDPAVKQLQ